MYTPAEISDYWLKQFESTSNRPTDDGGMKRMLKPHSTEGHPNCHFDSEGIMENPFLLDRACHDLLSLLRQSGLDVESIDRTVGHDRSSATVAHNIARHVYYSRDRHCLTAFVLYEPELGPDAIFFRKNALRPDERVLLIEDMVSTCTSAEGTAKAVVRSKGKVLPFIGALVNCSGLTEIDGRKIVALIDYPTKAKGREA